MKKALITGITGQDGSYLAEFLLEKGYEVHGIVRRSSISNTGRIDHLITKDLITLHDGDLSDSSGLINLIGTIKPDEIYNLAAQSHVGTSFDAPEYTGDVDAIGVLRLLEAIHILHLEKKTKFYQASTSELYGKVVEVPQSEKTPFHPFSPYAVAKQYGFWMCREYRDAYGIFAANGILFNHESPRRGENFVTRKITISEFRKESKKSRIKNILSYYFGALRGTFKVGKQDYVLAISQPPILGGLLGVWGKWIKHAKFIYSVQDFNPEQTIAVGYSKNKFILELMMKLDKFSCKRSDLIITVGRDLVQTIEKRFAKKKRKPKVALINNWIDEQKIYPLPSDNPYVSEFKQLYGLQNKFVIMYSGNLGLYYDLENIIKVIAKFPKGTVAADGKEVVFVFVGDGSVKERMVSYVRDNNIGNVEFVPYQDKDKLIYSLNAADVHFCVNAKGIKGVSCPSKFYGLAACAKPVLGVLEEGSEIRCIIKEINCGLCTCPEDYAGIMECK